MGGSLRTGTVLDPYRVVAPLGAGGMGEVYRAHLAQAADGLAKAHAAGIVHRDLKPENVMVTRNSYAKVLDFGLAKLTEVSASGSALAAAPTELASDATREGAVLGTLGYMSPEQAMGKPVDHRTDLFAFGCLLYEAATGKRPFRGESSVDVLHAIVRQKPEPVEEIAPQIPRALVRPEGARSLRNPRIRPGGDYVTFTWSDESRSVFSLFQVPVLGGVPRRLLDGIDTPAGFSPDGSRLAYVRLRPRADNSNERVLVVTAANGGSPIVERPMPQGPFGQFRWAPDGRGLTVRVRQGGDDNLWWFSIDGEERRQLTDMQGVRIGSYALSPDGKTLFFTKFSEATDAILIENFR